LSAQSTGEVRGSGGGFQAGDWQRSLALLLGGTAFVLWQRAFEIVSATY